MAESNVTVLSGDEHHGSGNADEPCQGGRTAAAFPAVIHHFLHDTDIHGRLAAWAGSTARPCRMAALCWRLRRSLTRIRQRNVDVIKSVCFL